MNAFPNRDLPGFEAVREHARQLNHPDAERGSQCQGCFWCDPTSLHEQKRAIARWELRHGRKAA